jgi:hypothetical protein
MTEDRPPQPGDIVDPSRQPTVVGDGTARLVAAHDAHLRTLFGPAGVQVGTVCAVHHHDDYVPIEAHHVWPLGMGGPDRPGNKVKVCANGHYLIHGYLDLLITYGDEVPWEAAQHYGPKVRELARRGWDQAGGPRRD